MPAVEFINISKSFGTYLANDNISLTIGENSVHCILGENGAGKSTLMKILFGIYKQDKGAIKIFGVQKEFNSPHDAINNKIGMVHQHFMLIDDFTILENVILGNEITQGVKINFEDARKILDDLVMKYNLGLNINKKISEISISQQQKVEILKLLFRDSEILIFDEPTAVLSPVEVNEFFGIVREFKNSGKTIILITHKLNEVKEISDKITVLRRGKRVYEAENRNKQLDIDELSQAIVGEAVIKKHINKKEIEKNKDEHLILENISFMKEDVKILNELNLVLRKGEIHGICGVEGNGQNEIVDIIVGLEKDFEGRLYTSEKRIALVPDDRIKKGMIKEYSIGENIILKEGKKYFITNNYLEKISSDIIAKYDVRVSNQHAALGTLSGGNQQKVIFAREIELDNNILIFSHPTRGVDINATLFIHNKIIEERNKNKAVLLISSDLDELITISDKLSVLYDGKIVKTFDATSFKNLAGDELKLEVDSSSNKALYEEIGRLMIGIT